MDQADGSSPSSCARLSAHQHPCFRQRHTIEPPAPSPTEHWSYRLTGRLAAREYVLFQW